MNKLINKRSRATLVQSFKVGCTKAFGSKKIADSANRYFCIIGEKLSKEITVAENPLLKGANVVNVHQFFS